MTVFAGVCSVTSCPFNRPGVGVVCGWLTGPSRQCHHPQYREVWRLLTEEAQALAAEAAPASAVEARTVVAGCAKMQAVPARPSSLTGRAMAASKPMDAARARQMLLDLGEV